ncbi:hypothetical protein Dda_2118 [Drechslerella dactyloides]|uniref:Peptidase S8/S53 domain-containing protein n=1 Tax=Drechslerella dactyloides TaxID=74499 RepID=A0AAD6J4R4_DREDA|nr:hypothetical protein Dda_2118 [Drechslerella dactyloides]
MSQTKVQSSTTTPTQSVTSPSSTYTTKTTSHKQSSQPWDDWNRVMVSPTATSKAKGGDTEIPIEDNPDDFNWGNDEPVTIAADMFPKSTSKEESHYPKSSAFNMTYKVAQPSRSIIKYLNFTRTATVTRNYTLPYPGRVRTVSTTVTATTTNKWSSAFSCIRTKTVTSTTTTTHTSTKTMCPSPKTDGGLLRRFAMPKATSSVSHPPVSSVHNLKESDLSCWQVPKGTKKSRTLVFQKPEDNIKLLFCRIFNSSDPDPGMSYSYYNPGEGRGGNYEMGISWPQPKLKPTKEECQEYLLRIFHDCKTRDDQQKPKIAGGRAYSFSQLAKVIDLIPVLLVFRIKASIANYSCVLGKRYPLGHSRLVEGMKFPKTFTHLITSRILLILLVKAPLIFASIHDATKNPADPEHRPIAAPEYSQDQSSDLEAQRATLGPEDGAIIEPYIFFLREQARLNTNVHAALVDELEGISHKSSSDHVLQSENMGTYFYLRSTTWTDAQKFAQKHRKHISAATRYLSLANINIKQKKENFSPNDFDSKPHAPHIDNLPTIEAARKINSFPHDDHPRRISIPEGPLNDRRTKGEAGHRRVHIYALDAYADVDFEHEAFQHAQASGKLARPVYVGPKSGRDRRTYVHSQSHQGTGVLGILIGHRTGVARHSNVLVNTISLSDGESREGDPLLLSALVQLYDAILSDHAVDDAVIVYLSPQRYRHVSSELSCSKMVLGRWLKEIMQLLGTLENVIIVTAEGDNEENMTWPTATDQLSNLIVIGGIDKAGIRISPRDNVWAYALAQDILVPAGVSKSKYHRRNGTALAAAAVSGILAGHLSRHPELSVQEAKSGLREASRLRHGAIGDIPIVWSGEKVDHSKSRLNGAATPVHYRQSRKTRPEHILDPKSRDAIIAANHTLPTLPTTFLHKRNPFPKPGYVTSTQVVLQIDLRPYRSRKTTTTKYSIQSTATATKTRTRVSVMPVREMFTSLKYAVATTIVAVPTEIKSDFKRTCYGLNRGAYFQANKAVDEYIRETFCRELVYSKRKGDKDVQEVGDKGKCGSVRFYTNPDRAMSNCAWESKAFEGTLGEVSIGVSWTDETLRPSYDTCVKVLLEQLVYGCDTEVTDNPLNYKGGGKVVHDDKLYYWIDPQRNFDRMRKPWPPRKRFLVCERGPKKSNAGSKIRIDYIINQSYRCVGAGFGDGIGRSGLSKPLRKDASCRSRFSKNFELKWELINNPMSPVEFNLTLSGLSEPDNCIIHTFNNEFGGSIDINLKGWSQPINYDYDLPGPHLK